MEREQAIELLDVVALIADDPRSKMRAGAEGTALEIMRDGYFEVEFSNEDGVTLHIGYYAPSELRRVWSARTGQPVTADKLVAA